MNAVAQFPTYGDSHEIDQLAVRCFENLLPASWLIRRQQPDYAVDCQVEVVEMEPTGFRFAVQIKGTRHKGEVKLRKRIATKSLRYLRDLERIPAFIFLVDVDRRTAHWVFAQKYLREQLLSERLHQRTVTVHFGEDDELSDISRFRQVLSDANTFVNELFPGSPLAALAKRKNDLSQLDSRFEVKVSASEKGEKIEIEAREPVVMGKITNLEELPFANAMDDFVRHGEGFKIPIEKFHSESPLVKAIIAEIHGQTVEAQPPRHSGVCRIDMGSDGSTQSSLQVEGYWQIGIESSTFRGTVPATPLNIESRIVSLDFMAGKEFAVTFGFRWEGWEGKHLTMLPWFTEIQQLANATSTGERVLLSWFLDGNRLCQAQMNVGSAELEEAAHTLEWFERCRSVCRYFSVDPVVPPIEKLTPSIMKDAVYLSELIEGKQIQFTIPAQDFAIRFVSRFANVPSASEWRKKKNDCFQITGPKSFAFLQENILLPNVKQSFERVELASTKIDGRSVELRFKATDSALLSYRWMNAK